MRVKSRKPPAENLITSVFGDLFQVVRRADDIVGDQMRHMAGHGQHQIVMAGIHHFHLAAAAFPEALELFHRGRIARRAAGVMMHQR